MVSLRHRKQAFEKLGDDLLLARKRHERVKEFDDSIFSRLDSSLGTAHEEGVA